MKKLLAVLMVLCIVLGLAACTKPVDPKDTTAANEKPYKGKTIEIWGHSSDTYKDIENKMTGVGNYIWMIRAAIDEWAYENECTVVYKQGYDANAFMAAVNQGAHPDLVYLSWNQWPMPAAIGATQALPDDVAKDLAEMCGENWLAVSNFKGKPQGLTYPWTGNYMMYYDKTVFENYGLKTPKELFMEDNWNFETFIKACKDVTKDTNGDGKVDTVGFAATGLREWVPTVVTDPQTGKLSSYVTTELGMDILNLQYTLYTLDKSCVTSGSPQKDGNPQVVMAIQDCEPYNYKHMFTMRGDHEIEVVPAPIHKKGDTEWTTMYTRAGLYLSSGSDDVEASCDLLKFLCRVGMRYMADLSVGLYKCDFEGIKGTSPYSKIWKEKFDAGCQERVTELAALGDRYDQTYQDKMYAHLLAGRAITYELYEGFNEWTFLGGTEGHGRKLPPASSAVLIEDMLQKQIEKYNSLYMY